MVPLPARQYNTLRSLEQIGDMPLYRIDYDGGYDLEELVEHGVSKGDIFMEKQNGQPVHSKSCSSFTAKTPDGDVLLAHNGDGFPVSPHHEVILFCDPPGGYASAAVTRTPAWEPGNSLDENIMILTFPLMPHAGMNERGLAIAEMQAQHGGTAEIPGKPTIKGTHLIRLILDKTATVDEAVELTKKYNNSMSDIEHYLITDASGKAAIIEYDHNGALVITRKNKPPLAATNFRVLGARPNDIRYKCRRYLTANKLLERNSGVVSIDGAMDILKKISIRSQPWWQAKLETLGSVVFNTASGEIDVAVDMRYDAVKRFRLPMDRNKPETAKLKTGSLDRQSPRDFPDHTVVYFPDRTIQYDVGFRNNMPHGLWTVYYPGGSKREVYRFVDGKRHGKHVWWYPGGEKKGERMFAANRLHGTWTQWDKKGNVTASGDFENGSGHVIQRYPNGNKKLKRVYENGKLNRVIHYYDSGVVWSAGMYSAKAGRWKWEFFR